MGSDEEHRVVRGKSEENITSEVIEEMRVKSQNTVKRRVHHSWSV